MPGYRGNVFFLHGERLDWLNKWATFQNDQYLRNRLLGLRNQLAVNIKHWEDIRKYAEVDFSLIQANTSILTGLDLFLSEPITQRISENDLYRIRAIANSIDMINSRLFMGLVDRKANKEDLIKRISNAKALAKKVISDLDRVLAELEPL